MIRRWHVRATAWLVLVVLAAGTVVWLAAWLLGRVLLTNWGVRP